MAALSVHLGVCSPNTLYWFILITPDIGTLYWVGQKVRLGCFFFFFQTIKNGMNFLANPIYYSENTGGGIGSPSVPLQPRACSL